MTIQDNQTMTDMTMDEIKATVKKIEDAKMKARFLEVLAYINLATTGRNNNEIVTYMDNALNTMIEIILDGKVESYYNMIRKIMAICNFDTFMLSSRIHDENQLKQFIDDFGWVEDYADDAGNYDYDDEDDYADEYDYDDDYNAKQFFAQCENIIDIFKNLLSTSIDEVKKYFPKPEKYDKQLINDKIRHSRYSRETEFHLFQLNDIVFRLNEIQHDGCGEEINSIKKEIFRIMDRIGDSYPLKEIVSIISYYDLFDFLKESIDYCNKFKNIGDWYLTFSIKLALKGGNIEFIEHLLKNYLCGDIYEEIIEANNVPLFNFCSKIMTHNKKYTEDFGTLKNLCMETKDKCPAIYEYVFYHLLPDDLTD